MGAAQTTEISGLSREEVAKAIFKHLDDDNSKRLDVTELEGQGCGDMVKMYFANREQTMDEVQFVNALLANWKLDKDPEYEKKALQLIETAKSVKVGTADEEKKLSECKDKAEMCGLVFEALDDDKSGSLDLKEVIKQLDPYHKKAQFVLVERNHYEFDLKFAMYPLHNHFDLQKEGGQVDYSMKYWEDIFKGYDKDKNGHVCKKEFSSALIEKFKDKEEKLFLLILAKMLKSANMINAAKGKKGETAEEKKKD
eukprot:jgi/Bigna1/90149/estExt_fgenesh1_pg.C_630089